PALYPGRGAVGRRAGERRGEVPASVPAGPRHRRGNRRAREHPGRPRDVRRDPRQPGLVRALDELVGPLPGGLRAPPGRALQAVRRLHPVADRGAQHDRDEGHAARRAARPPGGHAEADARVPAEGHDRLPERRVARRQLERYGLPGGESAFAGARLGRPREVAYREGARGARDLRERSVAARRTGRAADRREVRHRMTFGTPLLLLTLLAIPLIVAGAIIVNRRRAKFPLAFTNLDLLADIAPERHRAWRRALPLVFLVLALALAAGALAQPTVRLAQPHQHATLVLPAHGSGSMRANGVEPTRLDAAVAAMRTFLDRLPSQFKVGLVAFSSEPEPLVAPTSNRDVLRQSIALLEPEAGTAVGDGIG